jgi:hypothetical protein
MLPAEIVKAAEGPRRVPHVAPTKTSNRLIAKLAEAEVKAPRPKPKFTCDVCDKSYANEATLNAHKAQAHASPLSPVLTDEDGDQYTPAEFAAIAASDSETGQATKVTSNWSAISVPATTNYIEYIKPASWADNPTSQLGNAEMAVPTSICGQLSDGFPVAHVMISETARNRSPNQRQALATIPHFVDPNFGTEGGLVAPSYESSTSYAPFPVAIVTTTSTLRVLSILDKADMDYLAIRVAAELHKTLRPLELPTPK